MLNKRENNIAVSSFRRVSDRRPRARLKHVLARLITSLSPSTFFRPTGSSYGNAATRLVPAIKSARGGACRIGRFDLPPASLRTGISVCFRPRAREPHGNASRSFAQWPDVQLRGASGFTPPLIFVIAREAGARFNLAATSPCEPTRDAPPDAVTPDVYCALCFLFRWFCNILCYTYLINCT